ncbi:MAG: dihydrofolate reductase [Clostridia bacterium]|nr:dihydrofolate reductase [Clostridia bacterium]
MLIMIAAVGKKNELGKDNQLIWRLSKDMKFFRERTKNAVIVMGRKTFNSLPKILPNRRHIVLSKGKDFNKELDENVTVIEDKNQLISYCKELSKKEEVFIIGGASLYGMFMEFADRMYLTRIEAEDCAADVYFPEIEENKWEKTVLSEEEENEIRFCFVEYSRKRA